MLPNDGPDESGVGVIGNGSVGLYDKGIRDNAIGEDFMHLLFTGIAFSLETDRLFHGGSEGESGTLKRIKSQRVNRMDILDSCIDDSS